MPARPRPFTPVLALFFASGAVGLVYQVVWVRQFVHVFGATVLSVSTVLAAFMGGLALGGLWGGRIVGRLRDPLRAYGLAELGLAVAAALVPVAVRSLDPLWAAVYPSLSGSFPALSGVRFVASALVLLPPTFLMGTTLPFLVGHAERTPADARPRVAHLYAVNTFGAVAGTAGASFVLLPGLGLTRTWLVGLGLNALVAVVALLLARARRAATAGRAEPAGSVVAPAPAAAPGVPEPLAAPAPLVPRPLLLATAAALGFSALAFEVLWTRTLALALGTTAYGFAIVLTVFLVGIASGSVWAGRVLRGSPERALRVFLALPAAVGLLALALLPLFDRLPGIYVALSARTADSWGAGLVVMLLVSGLPLLPPTFASGAAFPLAVGLDRRAGGAGRSTGDVYAANTLGAIVGSWIAGFVLIPALGLRGGILLAAFLPIAATALLLLAAPGRGRRVAAAAVVVVALAAALATPGWDRRALTRGGFAVAIDLRRYGLTHLAEDRQELVFMEEGITTTVTVRRWGDELTMQMNGVTEASSQGDLATQVMLGAFGPMLHPDPRDVLVVGMASGISAAAAMRHPGIESLECVEISQAVVDASRLFDEANDHLRDDPRFRLVVDDARSYLRLSGNTYDVIVSQPSNVWNSGIGALMTSEFFGLASEHLRPGGILVSWIQGYSLDPEALRSVLAAVEPHFARCSLWMAGWSDLLIVAGDETLAFDVDRLLALGADPAVGRSLREMGAPDVLGLLSKNLLAGAAFGRYVDGATPNTDDNLYLEFQAPKLLYRDTIPGLFASLDAAMGGTEAYLVNAPPGLVESLARAREARILEDRARVAFRENRGAEGLQWIQQAYALHPTAMSIADIYAQALTGRGETRRRAGEVAGPAEDWLLAARLSPTQDEPWGQLSRLYRDTGQLETALEASDEALRRDPDDPEWLGDRAELHRIAREYEEAATWAREALAVDPTERTALIALGQSLQALGRTDEADSVWTAARRHWPDDPQIETLTRKRAGRS